ncbi:MAG: dockerin type I domain-containing protein [Acidobacteriota bacterium]
MPFEDLRPRSLRPIILALSLATLSAPAWGGTCAPDVNGDGSVDVLDVVAVTNDLGTSDPRSDLNGNGIVGTIDQLIVQGTALSSATACTCPADLDGTGQVDARDLSQLRGDFGIAGCQADLDRNGVVEANDADIVIEVILGNDSDPRADVNGDGLINISDAVFISPLLGLVCSADLNRDGSIDPTDIWFLLADWGPCP